MEIKANILVLGTSGAGKSTLINTIVGKDVARVGYGKHGTEEMECYDLPDLNFRLIDSRGFEYSFWHTRKAVKDMRTWVKKGLQDENPRIHMLWFCVDATSRRFTKQTFKTLEEVKKEWKEIPIIVVLTKSFFPAEDSENIEMVKDTFQKAAKHTGMPVAIIPVLAQPPKGESIVPRGIEELIRITEDHLDDAVRDSEEAVRKYDIKLKRLKAEAMTTAAALGAGVVGAIPISFPDAMILTPMETGLVTAIAKIYCFDPKKNSSVGMVVERLIETGTVGVLAKTVIGKLKLLPGLANLAADVLNAVVAAAIVFSIGEASTIVMEKIYTGEMDSKNLDWINQVIDKSTSTIVKKLAGVHAEKKDSLDIKDIMKVLLTKTDE